MTFRRAVSRVLDNEHRSHLDLLARVENVLPKGAGIAADPAFQRLAGAYARYLGEDAQRHFAFEERELFPRLADAGDEGIALLLTEEHEAMREVGAELLPLAQAALAGTLDAAGWKHFVRGTGELIERQVAHVQKETMALLPMLDDLIDDDDDRALAMAHAAA